jgi:hypothetical protein
MVLGSNSEMGCAISSNQLFLIVVARPWEILLIMGHWISSISIPSNFIAWSLFFGNSIIGIVSSRPRSATNGLLFMVRVNLPQQHLLFGEG